jgi:hypothetical protein
MESKPTGLMVLVSNTGWSLVTDLPKRVGQRGLGQKEQLTRSGTWMQAIPGWSGLEGVLHWHATAGWGQGRKPDPERCGWLGMGGNPGPTDNSQTLHTQLLARD